jgi:hypothetical protein
MSPTAPQTDDTTIVTMEEKAWAVKYNIHNLFNKLHPFWINNTKNWILLSKQYAHASTNDNKEFYKVI